MERERPHPPLVIMGVSGTGKTTAGAQLAEALNRRFIDGDDLHSAANKAKMHSGIALDDADRAPWLVAIGTELATSPPPIIACSALKRGYRNTLRTLAPGTFFIHLDGPRDTIAEYLRRRSHEFMSPVLLDSQLATLEALEPDEPHLLVSVDRSLETVTRDILTRLPAAVSGNGRELERGLPTDPRRFATTRHSSTNSHPLKEENR